MKFRIAASDKFLPCVTGGTSSSCILYSSCMIVFRYSGTSFSNICFLGNIPALHSLSIISRYARVSSSSLRFLVGSTSIVLLSISTITMIYLFPCFGSVGKCPVWSEKNVFLTSYMLMYKSRTLCPCSISVLGTSRGVRLGLVDLTCFLLVQMSFWRIVGFWVVYGYVAFSYHRPSYVYTFFDGFYPSLLVWIHAYCMHPLDVFFLGWQVV